MNRRCALCLTALMLLAGAAGCRTNPVTGRGELMFVSPDNELALGHRAHPDVMFMYDGEYHDPDLNVYLGTIVLRLHATSHRADMPVDFTILNTSAVNAFALPGHVYATRGFLAKLENEAQFAAVMGHELAHVAAGHSAQRLTQGMLTQVVVGVADVAAGDSLAGRLAVGAGQIGVGVLGLSYSREQERQADRVGTYYMALAGWDPREALSMQRLLASLGSDRKSVLDRYLATHPEAPDRLRETQGVIEEKKLDGRYVQGDGIYAARWRRRLRRLQQVNEAFEPHDRGRKLLKEGRAAEALAAAEEALAMRTDQAPFHVLRGDALLKLGRAEAARKAYEGARRVDPRYVPANTGLGLVHFAMERYAEAERQFAVAARGFPSGAVAWFGLGAARYHLGRYAEALPALEKVASANPNVALLQYMMAVCYEQAGRRRAAYDSYVRALQSGLGGSEAQAAFQRARALR